MRPGVLSDRQVQAADRQWDYLAALGPQDDEPVEELEVPPRCGLSRGLSFWCSLPLGHKEKNCERGQTK